MHPDHFHALMTDAVRNMQAPDIKTAVKGREGIEALILEYRRLFDRFAAYRADTDGGEPPRGVLLREVVQIKERLASLVQDRTGRRPPEGKALEAVMAMYRTPSPDPGPASGADGERCETCRYFGKTSQTCRRGAPVRRHEGDTPGWPEVNRFDWCGEWKPHGESEETS